MAWHLWLLQGSVSQANINLLCVGKAKAKPVPAVAPHLQLLQYTGKHLPF